MAAIFSCTISNFPQSSLCLPLTHSSCGVRYSLFNPCSKTDIPFSPKPVLRTPGCWIILHSWVINEAYCIHISIIIPINSVLPMQTNQIAEDTNGTFIVNSFRGLCYNKRNHFQLLLKQVLEMFLQSPPSKAINDLRIFKKFPQLNSLLLNANNEFSTVWNKVWYCPKELASNEIQQYWKFFKVFTPSYILKFTSPCVLKQLLHLK